MALTRSFLKGMGITDEQVSAIIEAHTETTDALKEQRDSYKESADKLATIEAELKQMKSSGDDWQKKYEEEHTKFEAYKTQQTEKDVLSAKRNAYTERLRAAGINEKRINGILKLTDLHAIELSESGELKDSSAIDEAIKGEWAEFIPSEDTQGASVSTPPATNDNAVDLGSLTMAEYIKARKN